MSDADSPDGTDDAGGATNEETISPWLDENVLDGRHAGPPPTREVLNRWLENVLWDTRRRLRKLDHEDHDVEIESVELEGEYPDIFVVIVFRDRRRPGCRFGYRWPVGQIAASGIVQRPAVCIWANFEEILVYDLPDDCDPHEITWLSDRARTSGEGPQV